MGPGVLDFQNTVDDWETLRVPAPADGNAPSSQRMLGTRPDGYSALNYGLFAPPDAQSFIVSPRRRLFNKQTVIALPVGITVYSGVLTLQDILTQDDGALFEYLGAQMVVALGAGATVTIRDVSLSVAATAAAADFFPLTTPTVTTLTPSGTDTLLFQSLPLITARDLDLFARLNVGQSIFTALAQPLSLTLRIGFQNTVAASTITSLIFAAMYRFVNGLTGA